MNNSTLQRPLKMVKGRDFYITVFVINAFSSVLATVLNLLIIVTLIKTPSLRTPSNILILSLAITDFGVGALVQPVYSSHICICEQKEHNFTSFCNFSSWKHIILCIAFDNICHYRRPIPCSPFESKMPRNCYKEAYFDSSYNDLDIQCLTDYYW